MMSEKLRTLRVFQDDRIIWKENTITSQDSQCGDEWADSTLLIRVLLGICCYPEEPTYCSLIVANSFLQNTCKDDHDNHRRTKQRVRFLTSWNKVVILKGHDFILAVMSYLHLLKGLEELHLGELQQGT